MRTPAALGSLLIVSLLDAGCASRRIIAQPVGPKSLPPKLWQSGEEQLARATRDASDPSSQLVALDNWEIHFPNSDFADVRLEQKILAYQQLYKWRETFDSSRKLLEIDPFRLRGLIGVITNVQLIAPTDDELQFAAAACRRMVDSPEIVYGHSDLPTRPPIVTAGLTILGWIDMQRKDYAQAILDLYALLTLDPTQARASYMLGTALLAQRDDPRAQRTAIFHFTRAATYDGPNALPPEQRKIALEYATRIWRLYFGTADGFEALASIARTNAFPSGEFR